jgi:hypothetical protein
MRYTWFTTYVWIWLHVHVNLMWLISSVAPLNKHSTILPPHSEHMLLNWDHHLGRETKQYSNHQAHHWLYSHHVPVSDQNILNPFKSYVCWLNCDAIQSTPNNVQASGCAHFVRNSVTERDAPSATKVHRSHWVWVKTIAGPITN